LNVWWRRLGCCGYACAFGAFSAGVSSMRVLVRRDVAARLLGSFSLPFWAYHRQTCLLLVARQTVFLGRRERSPLMFFFQQLALPSSLVLLRTDSSLYHAACQLFCLRLHSCCTLAYCHFNAPASALLLVTACMPLRFLAADGLSFAPRSRMTRL